MIKLLVERLTDYLVNTSSIENTDKALYEYLIEIFIQTLINFGITMLVGLCLNMFLENMVMYITFIVLRKFTGGLHSTKYIKCLCLSVSINLFLLIYLKYSHISAKPVIFILMILFSVIIISFLSPIQNANKKINRKEKYIFKTLSIVLSLCFSIISLILIKNNSRFGYPIGLAIITVSILVLFGKFINKNDEDMFNKY
mgnify:CR=1 FL=1